MSNLLFFCNHKGIVTLLKDYHIFKYTVSFTLKQHFVNFLIVDVIHEGGGNSPAVAVPLVALGTQSGTIDVIDISANAVAASFSVHSSVVRGLRWLGNSRLVSFSYTQVNLKDHNFHRRSSRTLSCISL